MADPFLQDPVGWQANGVFDPFAFEIVVNVGIGEAGVASKVDARDAAFVASHDWLQHGLPAVGAMDVAGTQRAALQIAKLVEHEKRMIAGAFVMPVPDAVLLFAMGGADAEIHVEDDALGRAAGVHAVDPLAGKIGERRQIVRGGEPACFEAPHLAGRRRAPMRRLAADDPAHRRVMPKPLGVVYVLIAGESPEDGLPQHPDERMSPVLAGASVGERFARHGGKPKRVVEFAIGEQSASEVTTDPRNWSIRRRSKLTLKTSPLNSPTGFVMMASINGAQSSDYYASIGEFVDKENIRHPVNAGLGHTRGDFGISGYAAIVVSDGIFGKGKSKEHFMKLSNIFLDFTKELSEAI